MAAHKHLSGYQFRFEKGNTKSPIGKETRHKVIAETEFSFISKSLFFCN